MVGFYQFRQNALLVWTSILKGENVMTPYNKVICYNLNSPANHSEMIQQVILIANSII